MITTRSFAGQTWTDLNSPSKEELDSLISKEHIDPLIAKDLLTPTPKQYVEDSGDYLYAVLHFPSFHNKLRQYMEQEVDFIIGRSSIITARYDSIDALHHFAKQVEVNEILNRTHDSNLLFDLTKEIYKFLFDELDYIRDWMRDIEKKVFSGYEREMVFSISSVSRNLIGVQRTLRPHISAWTQFVDLGGKKFGYEFSKQAKKMLSECEHILREVDSLSLMISELREANNSMLSTKQNEIMKIFTILAFVTFPLSLLASIFGMNTSYMPIVGLPHDFWMILSIMVFLSLVMFGYFKYKRWI